jgi:hypothetical protein
VLRRALDALTLRLDGSRAAANTITRKRAVFHGALGYAVEAGLLTSNPADAVTWQVPKAATTVDPKVVASPVPRHGWGILTLIQAAPRTAAAWTSNGTSHEQRGLKHRPEGSVRTVPIPPILVTMLRRHHRCYGTAPNGRLFCGTRGGPLSESSYGRTWHTATCRRRRSGGSFSQVSMA